MVIDGTKPIPLVERMATVPHSLMEGEYTFRDIGDWFHKLPELPRYIGMTQEQENWYRQLLEPKFMTYATVTYKGVPIIVID